MKMLGPWPVLQFIFGLAILGGGIFMIIKGTQKGGEPKITPQVEDQRDRWRAYEHLRNIEENSFKMVALMQQLLEEQRRLEDQLKALAAAIWNRGV